MSEPLTLSMLAGLESHVSGVPVTTEDREKLLHSLREKATFEGLAAYDISERLLDFLTGALQKPVAGIMGEVWRQRKELAAIAEKGKDKRNVEGNVELFAHTIGCDLHPSVELQVDHMKIGSLVFDVVANMKLQGVQFVIRNACITKIKAGMLTSTVSLQYKAFPLMPPCKKTIDLAMHLDLPGGGIPLTAGLPRSA